MIMIKCFKCFTISTELNFLYRNDADFWKLISYQIPVETTKICSFIYGKVLVEKFHYIEKGNYSNRRKKSNQMGYQEMLKFTIDQAAKIFISEPFIRTFTILMN